MIEVRFRTHLKESEIQIDNNLLNVLRRCHRPTQILCLKAAGFFGRQEIQPSAGSPSGRAKSNVGNTKLARKPIPADPRGVMANHHSLDPNLAIVVESNSTRITILSEATLACGGANCLGTERVPNFAKTPRFKLGTVRRQKLGGEKVFVLVGSE